MSRSHAPILLMLMVLLAPPAHAQSAEPSIELVAAAGRSLHVALDQRTSVKRVGQPVTATLLDAVYVYDRIVVPVGTKVVGRVDTIRNGSRRLRTRAILAGDFTPPRKVSLRFDTLVMSDGRKISIEALAADGVENVVMRVADTPEKTGVAARAREKINEAKKAAALVTAPDKWERAKVAAIRSLPYHPYLLARGTVYSAQLLAPVDFGSAAPAPRAAAGAKPAADSILYAQLATPIGSATSPRGTPIEATLTRPVFSSDGAVILPEGAKLTGEVTVSKPARRFRRNGQLRFLFQGVQSADRTPEPLLASLLSIESSEGDRVNVDEEGGIRSGNSKMRFASPALAALAVVGATHGRTDFDTDGAGPETQYGGMGVGTLGGFLGLGVFGIGVNSLGRYVTVATAALGLSQTVYRTVFAKGRELTFAKDTAIQVQLAPGPTLNNNRQESR